MSLDLYIKECVGCPKCGTLVPAGPNVFERNITHNLIPMWDAAGVYEALYESGGKRGGDYLPALEAGLAKMRADPDMFKAFKPTNGWGTYDGALAFLDALVRAVREFPDGQVRVSR